MATSKAVNSIKSSEFIVTIAVLVFNALNQWLGWGMSDGQLLGVDGIGATYVGGRSYAKGK